MVALPEECEVRIDATINGIGPHGTGRCIGERGRHDGRTQGRARRRARAEAGGQTRDRLLQAQRQGRVGSTAARGFHNGACKRRAGVGALADQQVAHQPGSLEGIEIFVARIPERDVGRCLRWRLTRDRERQQQQRGECRR